MRWVRRSMTSALVAVLGVALGASPRQAPPLPVVGVIANPSFEDLDLNSKLPRGWRPQGGGAFSIDALAHTGRASVRIASYEGADGWWGVAVSLKPHTHYRLTGWIRTDRVDRGTGRGALLALDGVAGAETPALTGTHDWTRVEVVFDSGDRAAGQVQCRLGGWGPSTGAAYFDDLQLEELPGTPEPLDVLGAWTENGRAVPSEGAACTRAPYRCQM
jgi:hypothetical protein